LEAKKISRSRCTELLHLTGNDFIEANRVLDSAEAAEKPGSYLGAIIRNLKAAAAPATNGARDPTVPDWVHELRAQGVSVQREGQHWRSQGEILNGAGESVGW
jgi:hypothetical protein